MYHRVTLIVKQNVRNLSGADSEGPCPRVAGGVEGFPGGKEGLAAEVP